VGFQSRLYRSVLGVKAELEAKEGPKDGPEDGAKPESLSKHYHHRGTIAIAANTSIRQSISIAIEYHSFLVCCCFLYIDTMSLFVGTLLYGYFHFFNYTGMYNAFRETYSDKQMGLMSISGWRVDEWMSG
jgi:hypothetical protein